VRDELSVYAVDDAPAFLQVHEGWHQAQRNNMSVHALKSFREFVGDSKARFPVPPSWPETGRTTNRPEEIMKWLPAFREWKLGCYWGKHMMQNLMGAGYEVLKDNPHFKGIGYFGGAGEAGAFFVPYLAVSKECAMLCPENVGGSDKGKFPIWREAARKDPERIKLLPHSYPMLVNATAEMFIDWFEDLASLPEVDGILLGGGGKVPVQLFRALAARHFGKGRMTEEEADEIIQNCRKKGTCYPDEAKKKRKPGTEAKCFLNFETARRAKAPKGSWEVDGDFGDWDGAAWYRAEKKENLLGGNKKEWKGKKDLSFSFAIGYDDEHLYLAVRVVDDKLVLRKYTDATGGDEVELRVQFIGNATREPVTRTGTKYFSVSPDSEDTAIYLDHGYCDVFGSGNAASKETKDGYMIEASIPWKEFGYTPGPGNVLPIDFHVLDADQLMGGVDHTMIWNAVNGKEVPWRFPKGVQQWGMVELQ